MSLSNNQKITILLAIFGGIITIWGITYTYSADLVYTDFSPPSMISSNIGNNLNFQLTNHGEKKGSYFLSLSSSPKEILFSKDSLPNSNEFKNDIKLSYSIGPKNNVAYNFKLMANKSNMRSNATVTFIFIDTSPSIFKKEFIWEFYYGLDNNNNNYKLTDKKLIFRDNIIIINGKIIN